MTSTTTNSITVGFPGVQRFDRDEAAHRQRMAEMLNRINQGKFNATIDVTLSANTGSTLISDSRIGYTSAVSPLMALSRSAALAVAAGIWFDAPISAGGSTASSIVAHHTASSAIDQRVRFGIFG